MRYRCPKCRELLAYDEKQQVHYCTTQDCDVEDGVYKDDTNLLEFGKKSLVVHPPTYNEFMEEVIDFSDAVTEEAEYLTEEAMENHKYMLQQMDYELQTLQLSIEEKTEEMYLEKLKEWEIELTNVRIGELNKACTYWQDKYYNTFDFKVLEKIKYIKTKGGQWLSGLINKFKGQAQ